MSLGAWYWFASHIELLEETPAVATPAPSDPSPVDIVAEIVSRYASGETQAQIGKSLGIPQPKISRILRKASKK